MPKADPFSHLHTHSEMSVKDGLAKAEQMILRAKANGQSSIALTDHGSLGNVPNTYRLAKEHGIQLIVGLEAYIVPDALEKGWGAQAWQRDGNSQDRRNFHLTLLAKNEQGYKDLVKLSSKAHDPEYHHFDPRMDYAMLREVDTENLICLSGCVMGELQETFLMNIREHVATPNDTTIMPRRMRKTHVLDRNWWWPKDIDSIGFAPGVLSGGLKAAQHVLKTYRSMFPEGQYFYEFMYHEYILEHWAQSFLLPEAIRHGVPHVVTNDSHYAPEDHKELHDLLMSMQWKTKFCGAQDGKTLDICKSHVLQGRMGGLISSQDFREGAENTLKIAEMCENFKLTPLERKHYVIPKLRDDNGQVIRDAVSTIYRLAEPRMVKLCEKFPERAQEYRDRFDFEMSVIKRFRYQHIFLITQWYVNTLKKRGVVVGAGRGSAAGSLVSYALRITEIDPIRHDLMFERFLDPERASMPDFDVDFQSSRIDEVFELFREKFGEKYVRRVVAYNRMRPKSIITEMFKAMDLMGHAEIKALTKELEDDTADHGDEDFMESWWENTESEQLKQIRKDSKYDLAAWSKQLYGLPTSVSKHAAAVVISDPRAPLEDWVPMQYMSGDKSVVTQFDMDALDAMGYVKFDALSLGTLDTLFHTFENIGHDPFEQEVEREGMLMYDDADTFRLISTFHTDGMFQLTGGTARQVLRMIHGARDFSDIVAVMSLGRPGAVKFASAYRENRDANWDNVKLAHPDLKQVLRSSYGVVLFQEDVMKITRHLKMSGDSRNDIMKAVKKKQYSIFDKVEEEFRECCFELGWSDKAAEQVYADIRDYAGYGFNKSHAVSYADLAYKTAFLKQHHPAAFIAAKMRQYSEMGDKTKKQDNLPGLVRDAQRAGVRVLPPNINKSGIFFSARGKRTIIAGLADIKDVGVPAAKAVIETREKRGFFKEDDFTPVYERVGPRGGKYMEGGLLEGITNKRTCNAKAVMAMAFAGAVPGVEIDGRWQAERELLYCNISEHPNTEVLNYLRSEVGSRENDKALRKPLKAKEKRSVKVGGVVVRAKNWRTKPDKDGITRPMAFLDLELDTHDFNVVVFPDVWEDVRRNVQEGKLVYIEATRKADPKKGESLIAERISAWGGED